MSTKPKISQNDLRKFMSEHKRKLLNNVKKIESPLAKYLPDGTLKCILCDSIVKSEAVWSVHINAKQHRENITKKKQPVVEDIEVKDLIKEGKRKLPIEDKGPPKKLKSILKNSTAVTPTVHDNSVTKSVHICLKEEIEEEEKVDVQRIETENDRLNNEVREGATKVEDVDMKEAPPPPSTDNDLPEGFFDNPLLDAKARNVEYKDPIEEEWERFQKEMKEENTLSAQIIHDESEVATVERQIVEVDEQLKNWSRVLDLEKKKESLHELVTMAVDVKKEESSDSSGDEDLEEFVSWRTKQSFQ